LFDCLIRRSSKPNKNFKTNNLHTIKQLPSHGPSHQILALHSECEIFPFYALAKPSPRLSPSHENDKYHYVKINLYRNKFIRCAIFRLAGSVECFSLYLYLCPFLPSYTEGFILLLILQAYDDCGKRRKRIFSSLDCLPAESEWVGVDIQTWHTKHLSSLHGREIYWGIVDYNINYIFIGKSLPFRLTSFLLLISAWFR
jgi:hypothetical protein